MNLNHLRRFLSDGDDDDVGGSDSDDGKNSCCLFSHTCQSTILSLRLIFTHNVLIEILDQGSLPKSLSIVYSRAKAMGQIAFHKVASTIFSFTQYLFDTFPINKWGLCFLHLNLGGSLTMEEVISKTRS